jgi:hypothetical protein
MAGSSSGWLPVSSSAATCKHKHGFVCSGCVVIANNSGKRTIGMRQGVRLAVSVAPLKGSDLVEPAQPLGALAVKLKPGCLHSKWQ